jgi:hypothetical protein
MKCPKNKKCPRLIMNSDHEILQWKIDERPICLKCQKKEDKRFEKFLLGE